MKLLNYLLVLGIATISLQAHAYQLSAVNKLDKRQVSSIQIAKLLDGYFPQSLFEKRFMQSYKQLQKTYKLIDREKYYTAKEQLDRVTLFFTTSLNAGQFEYQAPLVYEMLRYLDAVDDALKGKMRSGEYAPFLLDIDLIKDLTDILYFELLPAF